jgi:hypothetical protein
VSIRKTELQEFAENDGIFDADREEYGEDFNSNEEVWNKLPDIVPTGTLIAIFFDYGFFESVQISNMDEEEFSGTLASFEDNVDAEVSEMDNCVTIAADGSYMLYVL